MSDTVKLIIEIPKQAYELCKTLKSDSDDGIIGICAVNAIANGTPLPKGHGRLIDADVLVDGMEDDYEFCEVVNATPTIIESDKR